MTTKNGAIFPKRGGFAFSRNGIKYIPKKKKPRSDRFSAIGEARSKAWLLVDWHNEKVFFRIQEKPFKSLRSLTSWCWYYFPDELGRKIEVYGSVAQFKRNFDWDYFTR